jgi:hypothetical protein
MDEYNLDQIMEFLLPHLRAAFVPPEGGPERYGMSPKSQVVGGALDTLQGAGQRPPMPADGGAPLLIALLEAASRAQGPQMAAPQPMQPADPGGMRSLNAPSPASANAPGNVELLRKLLGSQ